MTLKFSDLLIFLGTALLVVGAFGPMASVSGWGITTPSYAKASDNAVLLIVAAIAASGFLLVKIRKGVLPSVLVVWLVLLWPVLRNLPDYLSMDRRYRGAAMDMANPLFSAVDLEWGGIVFLLGLACMTLGGVLISIEVYQMRQAASSGAADSSGRSEAAEGRLTVANPSNGLGAYTYDPSSLQDWRLAANVVGWTIVAKPIVLILFFAMYHGGGFAFEFAVPVILFAAITAYFGVPILLKKLGPNRPLMLVAAIASMIAGVAFSLYFTVNYLILQWQVHDWPGIFIKDTLWEVGYAILVGLIATKTFSYFKRRRELLAV